MENASKALIMAGSVLIALMIIGALMLMFGNLTSYQETDTQGTRSAQITEFNQQFETYNRDNVRGSDLYSLLNKVIDYNRRQSSAGTGATDRGQELQFTPMEITFTINRRKLVADGEDKSPRLFVDSQFSDTITVSKTDNSFEKYVEEKINDLEDDYGQDSLANLTTGLTKIFVDNITGLKPEKKEEIRQNFNAASRKVQIKSSDDLDKMIGVGSDIREDVYTYYEYIQFKRAHFDCTDIEYDGNTGRVIGMEFEFNGKFN